MRAKLILGLFKEYSEDALGPLVELKHIFTSSVMKYVFGAYFV